MVETRSWRVFAVAGLVGFLALGTAPLAAQEEQDEAMQEDGNGASGEEQEAVLDEIVVTAQKREQDQRQVPLSVSTVSTEEIETLTSGGGDVLVLSGRVPSVVGESSFGRAFPRFYIRGLGNTDFDLNASQPVSMVYDEIVLENPVVKGMPVWDIDRVEVLRGPQGTLFGRNTPAGVIKFESKKPSQELDAFVRASYGTYDTVDLQGAVGGRLTDTLSARFSGLVQSQSDWVDNTFTGEDNALGGYDNYAYRLQLLWEPSDTFTGLFNLHGWDVDGTARIFRANIIKPGTNDLVDGFSFDKVAQDGLNQQDISAQGGMMKLEWDLGGSTLTSVTGYETLDMFSRGDIDGGFGAVFAPPFGPGFIPFYSETADGIPDLEQITQEVRLTSNGDERLDWLLGAFYFDEDLKAETFSYTSIAPGNPEEGYAFQSQQAKSWALFGSVDWEATDRWTLAAGLRYTTDEKDFAAERPRPVFQTPTVRPIERHTDVDFVSWDASATYEVNPDVNVYGRVATSSRAPSIQGRILFCADFEGGLNPATNCVSVADQEDILSYEVGVKTELFDRRLRWNFTAYHYDVDGQQIVAVGGEFNTATLLNADSTEGYGFETDVDIAPSANWLINLGLSNNHTEIQDPNLAVAPCGGGCTVLDPIGPNGALVDGNSLPHAPEWIFNGLLDYRDQVGGGLLYGSFDWAWHSEKRFFLYESEEFRSDFFELGLRVGYVFGTGANELALYGRNLTDEQILVNGIDFDNLTGMVNDPGRLVGLVRPPLRPALIDQGVRNRSAREGSAPAGRRSAPPATIGRSAGQALAPTSAGRRRARSDGAPAGSPQRPTSAARHRPPRSEGAGNRASAPDLRHALAPIGRLGEDGVRVEGENATVLDHQPAVDDHALDVRGLGRVDEERVGVGKGRWWKEPVPTTTRSARLPFEEPIVVHVERPRPVDRHHPQRRRASIRVGSRAATLWSLAAVSISSQRSRSLLLAAPSVPRPTATPAASRDRRDPGRRLHVRLRAVRHARARPAVDLVRRGPHDVGRHHAIGGTPSDSIQATEVVPVFAFTCSISLGASARWVSSGASSSSASAAAACRCSPETV
ncbi:MAG: TonB-dependent receptor [Thermoanaerobaculia bacterium]